MKKYRIGKFVLFTAIAISIFFLMDFYIEQLQYFIGALIAMYGIDKAISFIDAEEKEKPLIVCGSIVQIILGICSMILFKEISTICVIWGVWAIMREGDEIAECYSLFKEKLPWILNFVESIVAIIFSITLIMEPGEHHAKIHMILLIVELLSAVILPQLVNLYKKYVKKDEEREQK